MTSQPPEPTAAQPFVRAAGAPRESGLGDQAIQTILLRRQVSELERRLQVLTEGERTARAALLESMGQSQASAREQARLHEELAAREHVVSNVLAREAGLQAELAQSRANLRRTELALERAQTCSDATPAAEAALTTSLLAELQLNAKLEGLSDHVAQRARILGFLAQQLRQDRERLATMRAALDETSRRKEQDLNVRLETQRASAGAERVLAKTRERTALNALLQAKQENARATQQLRTERWGAWQAMAYPPRDAPKRRNRAAKLTDRILCRLGPLGVATALRRSGLWNANFQVDNKPSARRATLLAYAGARPSPDATLKALFDQRFYLAANPSVAASKQPPLAHYLLHGDRENRSPHPLVDVSFYRAANPHELGSTGLTVLQHFLFVGAAKGLNPHPLFDVRHYVGQLSDPQDFMTNPLAHYLRTGWRRGFNPHPLFDNDGYLERHPDVADMMIAPLLHYVVAGAREGRDPHPLFFSHWYQTAYDDVRTSGQNPLEHFVDRGLPEQRNPNPFFESDHYLRIAPDAYAACLDPLQHYISTGAAQGLSPNRAFDAHAFIMNNPRVLNEKATPLEAWIAGGTPATAPLADASKPAEALTDIDTHRATLLLMFDAAHYLEQAGALIGPDDDPLDHYLTVGWRLGFNPHLLFDTAWYATRYPEVLESGVVPLLHLALAGPDGLNDPHPLFDSRWYAERYPDVVTGREIPLIHYLHFGGKEGRSPGPLFDADAYLAAYPDVRGLDPLAHFLTRWPLDNRPNGFVSPAAECPEGVDHANWIAGLADALVRSV